MTTPDYLVRFISWTKIKVRIYLKPNKNRKVVIFYVYQHPTVAWQFTEKREKAEGRNIPKKAFIEQFIDAKITINRIRKEFGNEVDIALVKKDYKKNTVETVINIKQNRQSIDDFIKDSYTKKELESIL
jgi:Zeta toxin